MTFSSENKAVPDCFSGAERDLHLGTKFSVFCKQVSVFHKIVEWFRVKKK
jgi:hypothetical protein